MVSFLRLSLARQFMLASLLILLGGMVVIGRWVERQIELGVLDRTQAVTALYMDSVVSPHLQDLASRTELDPSDLDALGRLLTETPLGQRIVAFKVWASDGTVLFSSNPELIERRFTVSPALQRAFSGSVITEITNLEETENVLERSRWERLIETYAPIRETGSGRIIAVSEFYQTPDELDQLIAESRFQSWLVVGGATALMYLLLAGLVGKASATIQSQQAVLEDQVSQLRGLLAQNNRLHERLRLAALRTAASNERLLSRISADLHDGPAQDLGLGLLRIEALADGCADCPMVISRGRTIADDFQTVRGAMASSLAEVRSIAAGLRLPAIESMSPAQTIERAAHAFQRNTNLELSLEIGALPDVAPWPVKVALFRVLQEALSNAFRHAGGRGLRVDAGKVGEQIVVSVSDEGPGFTWPASAEPDRLGLSGMRERAELIGGSLDIMTEEGRGTRVRVSLPLTLPELDDE